MHIITIISTVFEKNSFYSLSRPYEINIFCGSMKYYKQLFSPLNQNSVNIAKNTLALFYDCKSQQSTNNSYPQVFYKEGLALVYKWE